MPSNVMILPSVSGNQTFIANQQSYTNQPVNLSQMRDFVRGVDVNSGLNCIVFHPASGVGEIRWVMPSIAQMEVEYSYLLTYTA